ncbi:MAG: RNA-binding cell elongation regulator Jag/EloR [Spirochaetota bacterium]
MLVKEFSGKSEKEAVKNALEELGLAENEVRIEVLDKGKRSILGIGEEIPARVRIYYEEISNRIKDVKDILENVLKLMSVPATVAAGEESASKIYINIDSPDSGVLIGKKGSTLEALQFLVTLITSKMNGRPAASEPGNGTEEEEHHIIIDIDGYRKRREETLKDIAWRMASVVKRTRRPKMLEPMNPYERRIIHLTLQDDKDVETKSEGDGTIKQVCILPKGGRAYGGRGGNGGGGYGRRGGGGGGYGGGGGGYRRNNYGGGGNNYGNSDRNGNYRPSYRDDNYGPPGNDREIPPEDDNIGNRIDDAPPSR